jgi:sugar phosphate isomerase/epimerase
MRRSTLALRGRSTVPRRDPLERLTVGHFMMRQWSLEDDVRQLERLGFRSISLASTKLDAYGPARAIALLKGSILKVAHVGSYGRFGTTRATQKAGMEEVRRAIGWVHELGGEVLVVIAGARDGATWERAAKVYADAYAALLPEATTAGIGLAIEVIHPLRQDLSFVNTLADAREMARGAGPRGGYVLDVWHSGWERRLLETIAKDARRRIHAVQLSDYKAATMRTLDRALLGEGILPLRDIVRTLERSGYRGWYEAEIISDDIDAMGYERALRYTRDTFVELMGRG